MFKSHSDVFVQPTAKTDAPFQIEHACKYCNRGGWLMETDLEIHRKIAHKKKLQSILNSGRNVCTVCIREFPSKNELLKHIKGTHLLSSQTAMKIERETFICDYCKHIFFNKKMLAIHIYYYHMNRRTVAVDCPKCNKKVFMKTIHSHFKYHKMPSISNCRICLEPCDSNYDLQHHLKSHMYYLYCDVCQFYTHKRASYDQHMANHKSTTICKDFTIQDVEKYFVPNMNTDKLEYYQYFYEIKGLRLPKSFSVCIMCREICHNRWDMVVHIERDHKPKKIEAMQHKCECGETFLNQILLKHHLFKNNHKSVS